MERVSEYATSSGRILGFYTRSSGILVSFGAELLVHHNIAFRAGYFGEHSTKGNRKYFTTGLGYTYKFVTLNGSYLIPTSNQRNPLDNIFKVSLLFNFGSSDDTGNS